MASNPPIVSPDKPAFHGPFLLQGLAMLQVSIKQKGQTLTLFEDLSATIGRLEGLATKQKDRTLAASEDHKATSGADVDKYYAQVDNLRTLVEDARRSVPPSPAFHKVLEVAEAAINHMDRTLAVFEAHISTSRANVDKYYTLGDDFRAKLHASISKSDEKIAAAVTLLVRLFV
ncbi:expressed unknown protein [Seminavis robusta]|uniref:Uncharacterized protein n=1 Tax=Seminavis robusta TaxID=568900 RepID=A0A9N8HJ26_9STRA|nr:expressed unknown protein [Seminavis robusta]|eukprot:Sro630_g178380.1 n/a (174) ;mRNA; r:49078-49599